MANPFLTWARRLGWTLLPVLVLAVAAWMLSRLRADAEWWPLLPALVAVFLIGARVRERW